MSEQESASIISGYALSAQQLNHIKARRDVHPYGNSAVIQITGAVDKAALYECLVAMLDHHKIFKTRFTQLPAMTYPIQVIDDNALTILEVIDLQKVDEECCDEKLEEVISEIERNVIGKEQHPGPAIHLIHCPDYTSFVYLALPALQGDSQSLVCFFRELGGRILRNDTPESRDEQSLEYVHYCEWQKELLSDEYEDDVKHWRDSLQSLPARGAFPFEKPVGESSVSFSRISLYPVLSKEAQESIKRICRERAVSSEQIFLAVWSAFMGCYLNFPNTVVWVEMDGRSFDELKNVIGPFSQSMPVQLQVRPDRTLLEIATEIGVLLDEIAQWQDFSTVLRNDAPECYSEQMASAGFAWRHYPQEMTDGQTIMSVRSLESLVDEFAVKLECHEFQDAVELRVLADTSRLDAPAVTTLTRDFAAFLEDVIRHPNSAISDLALISPETKKSVQKYNTPYGASKAVKPIPKLIAEQARATPSRTAIIYDGSEISFGELDYSAERLADVLRSSGLGCEDYAALLIGRSIEYFIGLYSVWKAGAAFVPLDPCSPELRLNSTIGELKPKVIITQKKHLESLSGSNYPVICLDEIIGGKKPRLPDKALQVQHSMTEKQWREHDPAYAIFTSGASGKQKAAIIEHQSVAVLNAAFDSTIYKNIPKKPLKISVNGPLTADTSIKQIMQLANGHTLDILPQGLRIEPDRMIEYVADAGVNVLDGSPLHVSALVDSGLLQPRYADSLHAVLVGGDGISDKLWSELADCETIDFYNMYGPTECCVDTLYGPISDDNPVNTVGKPLPGARAYILNRTMEQVPPGVKAELFIGGFGVARGYLGNPALTAQSFVPDPFSTVEGERLYKTSDLASYRNDGTIVFHGRLDNQVKIRGFRVELEEIESAVQEHPLVRKAAAIFDENVEAVNSNLVCFAELLGSASPLQGGYFLPNGLELKHLNKNETDFLYNEIFIDNTYLRGGVSIKDGDTIFDVGANIGLFSLYAKTRAKGLKIYAFEPVPELFEILSSNIHRYVDGVKLFEMAISSHSDGAEFTYYPGYSIMSGFYADEEEEKNVVKRYIQNQNELDVNIEDDPVSNAGQVIDDLLKSRFEQQEITCRTRTISQMIEEEGVESLDLLKIDVQKSEMDVLLGIADEHWKIIKQISMEVHDNDGRLQEVVDYLTSHGFRIMTLQDELLEGTDRYNLYAVHEEVPEQESADPVLGPESMSADLVPQLCAVNNESFRKFCEKRLPAHMLPNKFIFCEQLPINAMGKILRGELDAKSYVDESEAKPLVTPRNLIESKLLGIWTTVLKHEQIGVCDNFFDLGGHSLLAIQLVSRIRKEFNIELPISVIFDNSTIEQMAKFIEDSAGANISADKGNATDIAFYAMERPSSIPLSLAQRRLWFIDQLQPNTSLYNFFFALEIKGALDRTALMRSIDFIVNRHEILRTTFSSNEGIPEQIIHANALDKPIFVSLCDIGGNDIEVKCLLREEAQRPFNLELGPLARFGFVELSESSSILFVGMHHIITDVWSGSILVRELVALYKAFSSHQPVTLEKLAYQYADYAVYQEETLSGAKRDKLVEYWARELDGVQPVLNLQTDYAWNASESYEAGYVRFSLNPAATESLSTLAHEYNVTPFMALLAIFYVLLYRYTNQEDICIGTPVANRNDPESERLLGFFVNTLVLRAHLSDDLNYLDILQMVREKSLSAFAHQELPFDVVVEELQPERSFSHSPLFQVLFALQPNNNDVIDLPGLEVNSSIYAGRMAKFDLSLIMQESDKGYTGTFEYNSALFQETSVRRMARHFECISEQALNNPKKQIWSLALIDKHEQRILVRDWNKTRSEYMRDMPVHKLYESVAEKQANQMALCFTGGSVTYKEVNERANRLAHYLLSQGVSREARVGVCLPRSAEMIISLLGILKCGAVYVSLDSSYPSERLADIVDQAAIDYVISDSSMKEKLNLGGEKKIICIDEHSAAIDKCSGKNPQTVIHADNLAYICFTSGSTGKPKGVSIPHRAVVRLAINSNYVDVDPQNVFLLHSPISFDASTFEIWVSLLNGAQLAIADEGMLSLSDIAKCVEINKVDTLWLTAALFRQMVEYDVNCFRGLHQLLVGGDAVSIEHSARLVQQFPDCSLINGYGPSENTTFSTHFLINDIAENASTMPIGKPVSNSLAYVLDRGLNPVPVGMPGELYVAGDGLARGYWARPDLTAERFLPDPFSEYPSARMYKTGDRVRYKDDGTIEFLGRIDRQLKLRGYRIEPQEIEHVISQNTHIRDTFVCLTEGSGAEKKLVAYVVPENDQTVVIADLEESLQRSLPGYMQPSSWVVLDSLPLNANGKIDKHALNKEKFAVSQDRPRYIEPETTIEILLADIWMELLGVEYVGKDDNFFKLGGHSLLATQLVALIKTRFGVDIPLVTVFEYPVLSEFSDHVSDRFGLNEEELAAVLDHIEALSDDEVQLMLHESTDIAQNQV